MNIRWTKTPGLQKALETAVEQKLTASQIARHLSAKFGLDISREAVAARIRRSGLVLAARPGWPHPKMAVHNYIPHDVTLGTGSRNIPIKRVIEDPYTKNSRDTLPIQMADVCAYFLHQHFAPNSYIRKQRAQNYFERLDPVLNKRASRFNTLGVVVV